MRLAESELGGSSSVEIQIDLPSSIMLESPETLGVIERLETALEGFDELGTVTSLLDPLRRLNRLLSGDDPAQERIADSLDGNAQILEILSLDDPRLVESLVSIDRKKVRLSIAAPETDEQGTAATLQKLDEVLARILPADWNVTVTGEYAMTVHWLDAVQSTQLSSFPIACCLVFIILAAFFRSLSLAAAAMVPGLLPVIIVLGGMGWVGLSLDVGRTMIAAVVIGIAVDDSVHLLWSYRARRIAGRSRADSMDGAIQATGKALIITSVALAAGFLTLLGSAWQTIASFGLFISVAIVIALLATVVLLPAIAFRYSEPAGSVRLQTRSEGALCVSALE
jgi:predicted RND superfamily exporter protein